MVFVDGVKFACNSCISGHRSSKCTHTTRPLWEIKKKGRRPTQCVDCQELRKSRASHVKCNCKNRQAIPPTTIYLPNGISDLIKASEISSEPPKSSTVNRLLNACDCSCGEVCKCTPDPVNLDSTDLFLPPEIARSSCCGDSRARKSCCRDDFETESERQSKRACSSGASTPVNNSFEPTNTCCSSKSQSSIPPIEVVQPFVPSIPLPPINTRDSPLLATSTVIPDILFVPSTHGTFACFCGDSCSCVGCPQHDPHHRRGSQATGCGCGPPKVSPAPLAVLEPVLNKEAGCGCAAKVNEEAGALDQVTENALSLQDKITSPPLIPTIPLDLPPILPAGSISSALPSIKTLVQILPGDDAPKKLI